jgi:hypothetical protein
VIKEFRRRRQQVSRAAQDPGEGPQALSKQAPGLSAPYNLMDSRPLTSPSDKEREAPPPSVNLIRES